MKVTVQIGLDITSGTFDPALLSEARKMLGLKHTQETAELAVLLAQEAIAAVESGQECASSWAEILAKLATDEPE